jgi:RNA polymerase sigma-70 factor (sigma-E family)
VSFDDRVARGGWSTDDAVQLYAAHRLTLVRLALLLVDDQDVAEDVVHDAFAGLLARRGLTDPDSTLAQLRTAVVHGSRSVLRRRRTQGTGPDPGQPEPRGAVSSPAIAEEHREVLDVVRRLPARQREVLVLRYWAGLSEGEIAEVLGVSRGTVTSTARRALAALESSRGARQ